MSLAITFLIISPFLITLIVWIALDEKYDIVGNLAMRYHRAKRYLTDALGLG